MATLWIEEYQDVPRNLSGSTQPLHDAAMERAEQKITIGTTSVQSEAFTEATRYALIHADGECYFEIGENPVATTETKHLAAGVYRDFKVRPGWKIAVKNTS